MAPLAQPLLANLAVGSLSDCFLRNVLHAIRKLMDTDDDGIGTRVYHRRACRILPPGSRHVAGEVARRGPKPDPHSCTVAIKLIACNDCKHHTQPSTSYFLFAVKLTENFTIVTMPYVRHEKTKIQTTKSWRLVCILYGVGGIRSTSSFFAFRAKGFTRGGKRYSKLIMYLREH